MIVLGVPTLIKYDMLVDGILTAESGSVKPDKYFVVDNGWRRNKVNFAIFAEDKLPKNILDKIQIHSPANNIGVSASWNYTIREFPTDELIIANDDIEYLEDTIEALIEDLRTAKSDTSVAIVHGNQAKNNAFSMFCPVQIVCGIIGEFDEFFYPAYFEDCDYFWRIRQNGYRCYNSERCDYKHSKSATVASYTEEEEKEHHRSFLQNKKYYIQKWGGEPGHEQFKKPFNREI